MAQGSDKIRRIILGLVVAAVFFGSLILLSSRGMFVSPDETANAFFARTFAATGKLTAFEPLNGEFGDALVPRSVISLHGFLAPGAFLGLPAIYGGIVKLLGGWALLLITPSLAALAVFAWYGIASRTFGRDVGFVSALLLAVLPGWWYYAARSLMPNVPFVACVLFGAYFLIARPIETRFARAKRFVPDVALAGAFVSAALFIRTSEALWLFAASFAAAWILRRAITRRMIIAFVAGFVFVSVPFFVLNDRTYGSPFATGYTAGAPASDAAQIVQAPVAETATGPASELWARVQEIAKPAFPFGIHPRNVARNVASHGLELFWWMTLASLAGIAIVSRDRGIPADERRQRFAYHVFAIIAVVWLFVMYGSWNIYDNPDPNAVSIANSYVRYWLPAFLLATPYAATAILWLIHRPVTTRMRRVIAAVLALACAGLSIYAVYFAKNDGLVAVAQTLQRSADIKKELLALTESDAVVIADRSDKLLFPDRRVRYPLRDEATYALMPKLVLVAPLYYYGITFPAPDLFYLNEEKLKGLGLRIELVKTFDAESLYRIRSATSAAFAQR